jgi:hypothetical protein
LKILLLNQAFYPDVVSTSQHLTDLARELVTRGHQVSVIAGRRGYDDPSQVYPRREIYRGIQIYRLDYSSFGKGTKWRRAIDIAVFQAKLLWKLLFYPRQDVVVGLTSPPLIAVLGNLFCMLKKSRFVYWVMDLNPDEAIAAGWLREGSPTSRILLFLNHWAFHKSHKIIALDRFMKKRIEEEHDIPPKKIEVLAPWAHDEQLRPIEVDQNPFRKRHGLNGKFVVMYSGNHSPCHPLDTLLEAALRYKEDKGILFLFVGGGSLVKRVRDHKENNRLQNIVQLPYEPLDALSESLSAADLHVAVMGNPFVGIVHPCKIYGILSVGRPFVFIGPRESHVGDLLDERNFGYRIEHGDVEGLVTVIEKARRLSQDERKRIEIEEVSLKNERFSRKALVTKHIDLIESLGSPLERHE